jgi:Dynein heavy chain, N-terminal region 2
MPLSNCCVYGMCNLRGCFISCIFPFFCNTPIFLHLFVLLPSYLLLYFSSHFSHTIPPTFPHTPPPIPPPVLDLRNPSLKDRHWALINNLTGTDIRAIPDFTLSNLLSSGVTTFREQITFISSSAQQESILVSDLVCNSDLCVSDF